MGGLRLGCGRELIPDANQDGLAHAFVEGNDVVMGLAVTTGVMKCADDGGIAAGEDAGNPAEAAAVGAGWGQLDQDLVSLHGAVDLVGRNEYVIVLRAGARYVFAGLARVGTDEAVTVAMEVEPSGDEVVAGAGAGGCRAGQGEDAADVFDEMAACDQPPKLFQQQATLAAAAEAELAHKLLVAGFRTSTAGDVGKEGVVVHKYRV